jgi:nucleotide-binding universal stress UspA family protein
METVGGGIEMREWTEAVATGDAYWSGRDDSVILTPLDGSEPARAALPVAMGIGQALGWVVHVLRVGDRTLTPPDLLATLHLSAEDARGLVLDQAPGVPNKTIVEAAAQQKAGLVVMTTRAGETIPRRPLGPVAEDVLRGVSSPVILVRPEFASRRSWEVRRVVIPHDGTPSTSSAIGPGIELARRLGADLDVLYVATRQQGRPRESGSFAGPRYIDQPQHEWPSWANEFVQRLVELGHRPEKVRVRFELGYCEPGEAIVKYADEHGVDLIVLVWRGRLDRAHGQIIRSVLRTANCPLLMLKTSLA